MPSTNLPPSMHVDNLVLTATTELPIVLPLVGAGSHVEVSYLGKRYPAQAVSTDGRTTVVRFEVHESNLFEFALEQVRR